MIKIIATKDLKLSDLPRKDANWDLFTSFALTFDPRIELEDGNFPFSTYSIEQTPTEDSMISEIRLYLYSQQRWWNHQTHEIDAKSLSKIHNVIEILRNKLKQD